MHACRYGLHALDASAQAAAVTAYDSARSRYRKQYNSSMLKHFLHVQQNLSSKKENQHCMTSAELEANCFESPIFCLHAL